MARRDPQRRDAGRPRRDRVRAADLRRLADRADDPAHGRALRDRRVHRRADPARAAARHVRQDAAGHPGRRERRRHGDRCATPSYDTAGTSRTTPRCWCSRGRSRSRRSGSRRSPRNCARGRGRASSAGARPPRARRRAPRLLGASVPLWSNRRCLTAYERTSLPHEPALQLCAAKRRGGVDTCQGDSGGPLDRPSRQRRRAARDRELRQRVRPARLARDLHVGRLAVHPAVDPPPASRRSRPATPTSRPGAERHAGGRRVRASTRCPSPPRSSSPCSGGSAGSCARSARRSSRTPSRARTASPLRGRCAASGCRRAAMCCARPRPTRPGTARRRPRRLPDPLTRPRQETMTCRRWEQTSSSWHA